jgi:hypothetical protein
MTLEASSKLGPYEILSQIGAEGMGEVYRAKDPRLGRKDQAFNWWAKACEDNSFDVATLKLDPLNDELREDPRFADLLRKAKLGP